MPDLLLTAQDSSGHIHLIIGSGSLANARCTKSLQVGAKAKVVAPAHAEFHHALSKRVENGEAEWIRKDFEEKDLMRYGRNEVDNVVDGVFVTSGGALAVQISNLCRRLRIPVNVTDTPSLCTFTLLSTHCDGPLQIGITTSGNGCKLASRVRREIASFLPPNFGTAVERLGIVRRRLWEEDHRGNRPEENEDDSDTAAQNFTFNQLVTDSDHNAAKTRRMRWLSQICEYWPLARLTSITEPEIDTLLESYASTIPVSDPPDLPTDHKKPKPEIILAGSGPGSPYLLTLATHRAILTASVILADKLVPSPILDLIPRRTPVHIARKFPGNADAAQAELLSLGLSALRKGLTVLRLKQGDPYIYGRGGEEFEFFRERGFNPIVLPGITSALSAPLFASIPATQRGVADQVLICTGTGRKGAAPAAPPYVPTQTVLFLMALHRLPSLIDLLTITIPSPTPSCSSFPGYSPNTKQFWPPTTPCAVLERASCHDQRVIRSTLQHICAAVEEEGSRPPGLLVVGRSCEVLIKPRDDKRWVVEEGFEGLGSLELAAGALESDGGGIGLFGSGGGGVTTTAETSPATTPCDG